MCNQKYRCDYAKDLEHENACLQEAYDEMRDILMRTRKLLEALSIIEAIEHCLPTAKEVSQ